MEEDVCDEREVHGDRVARATGSMPGQDETDALADFFRIFGDRTRIRILLALDPGEMCVCDISEALGISMSATSHQLRMLREAHLVTSRREGKSIYYSLCDEHVRTVLETALEHVGELRRRSTKSVAGTVPKGPIRPLYVDAAEFVGACISLYKMLAIIPADGI